MVCTGLLTLVSVYLFLSTSFRPLTFSIRNFALDTTTYICSSILVLIPLFLSHLPSFEHISRYSLKILLLFIVLKKKKEREKEKENYNAIDFVKEKKRAITSTRIAILQGRSQCAILR